MKQPTTPAELAALHKLLKSDPQQYLSIVNSWIDKDPTDHHPYFSRHFAWMKVGSPQKALDDLNRAIALQSNPDPMSFLARGNAYRHLGEYKKPSMITIEEKQLIHRAGKPTPWAFSIRRIPTRGLAMSRRR